MHELEHHRAYLWAVGYRLLGDVGDAEDLVQTTFARALERPPSDRAAPLRPWLTRVATNLAIDRLRRRRHQAYDGPWLPAPVEALVEVDAFTRSEQGLPELAADARDADDDPEHRYGQLESARFALLIALEALEPKARAVLILRDVIGYAGPEVAAMLELSPVHVRVLLHRARKQLAARRLAPGHAPDREQLAPRLRTAFEALFVALASGDEEALARLLADEVRVIGDAGGEFLTARKIVEGRADVVALLLGITRGDLRVHWTELREINGELASVSLAPKKWARSAERSVIRVELDAEGRVAELHLLVATRKLAAIDFSGPRQPAADPAG